MNRPAFIDDAAFNKLLANGHRTAGGDAVSRISSKPLSPTTGAPMAPAPLPP